MSGTFTPTPAISTSYTTALDGEGKPIASLSPFLQGLANAVAATPSLGFNFGASVGLAHNAKRAAFVSVDQAWIAVGDGGNDFLEVSFDAGRTWVDFGPGGSNLVNSGLVIQDVAANPTTGLIVAINETTRTTYTGARSAYGTWGVFTTHANAISANLSKGSLDFDAVHTKFVACYRSGGAGMRVDTSADGVTWAAIGLPASWNSGTTIAEPWHHVSANGKSVAWFWDDVASLYRVVSSSDSITFTDRGSLASTIPGGPTIVTRPVRDAVYDVWYLVASSATGTRRTEVFKSTDSGATWTALGIPGIDMALQDFVVSNGRLVGANDDGRIFVCDDGGTTWKLAGRNPIAAAGRPGMRHANGQMIVVNPADKKSYASTRFGASGV